MNKMSRKTCYVVVPLCTHGNRKVRIEGGGILRPISIQVWLCRDEEKTRRPTLILSIGVCNKTHNRMRISVIEPD